MFPVATPLCIVGLLLALSQPVNADPPLPVIPNRTTNVLSFGAFGNGSSNNAAAINAAINAISAAGGGTVVVSAVGILTNYLSGPINLANYVSLQVDSGAVLRMFPQSIWTNAFGASTPFINGSNLHDIEINGLGTIDGQGTNWWFPLASTRPNFVNLSGCTNVLIQNVTLQNPPAFHMMLKGNNVNLTIQGITENTPGDSHNTDGMDVGASNVLVRNCFISVGDDNIEIGGSVAAVVDMTVSNCFFGTGHGVSLGSLVNGAGGGVRNLLVSNCTFNGTVYGIRMKSDRDRGGVCENLRYFDITMTNVGYAIVIYSYYNSIGTPNNISTFRASTDTVHAVTSTTPIWRNITISNLTASGLTGSRIAGIVWGVPEMLVSNVTLYNVNISAPTKTFDIYNARAIRIVDSQITTPSSTNSLTLYNAEVIITNSVVNTNLVTLGGLATPPTNNVLTLFNAQALIMETNMLGTGPITLGGSTLTFNQSSVNSFNSNIAVLAGSTLIFTDGVNVINGILSGSGSIRGTVMVNGTLAPGTSPGTLTFTNNLTLNGGAMLSYDLGTNSDLTIVSGNLTLGGTLNVTDAGGFANGIFKLFAYAGALTYNGVSLGNVPAGFNYAISTNTPGEVDLVVTPLLTAFEQWQIDYFGSTNNPAADPNADPDGDGLSNTNEFLVGTDPTNSASFFGITSVTAESNDIRVTWMTGLARTNALERSAGEAGGSYSNNFATIFTVTNAVGPTTNYLDVGAATNFPARYYRVRLVQ